VAKVHNNEYDFEHTEMFSYIADKWPSKTSLAKIKSDVFNKAVEIFSDSNKDVKDVIVLDKEHFLMLWMLASPEYKINRLGAIPAYAKVKLFNENEEIVHIMTAKIGLQPTMDESKIPMLKNSVAKASMAKYRASNMEGNVISANVEFCCKDEYLKYSGDPFLYILFGEK
jgi:hypothetical protein